MIWRALFGAVLTRLDAERAHHLGARLVVLCGWVPGLRWLLTPRDPRLAVRAFGRTFPSPLGLAAGFDKDAAMVDGLHALGFGFVEVGTVTASPQEGNPRPRMFRLPEDRALVNRMGFNNAGAAAAERRLRRRRTRGIVGVNVGKTKRAEDAVADYVEGVRRLVPYADYVVLNVSSPNTPGLRDLQAVDALRELVRAVRPLLGDVPLLVKIAPDLSDEDVDAIADLALAERLDGLIATNTTTSRAALRTPAAAVDAAGAGGLSGAPLKARSLAVLRRLRARVGDEVVLVAAGGVEDAADVVERLRAGATLVQAYTGFVYGGPLWPRRVQNALLEQLAATPGRSVGDLIGSST